MKNFYHILGVTEDASLEQINEAYKKLAQKYHPDKNNNDPYFTSLFREINEAKKVLSDLEERSEYDLNLTNYSDAYELFIQQKHDDEFNRQQRRLQFKKQSSFKMGFLKVAGGFAVLLVATLIYLRIDDDNFIFSGGGHKAKGFQEVAGNEVATVKSNVAVHEKIKDTLKPETGQPLLPASSKSMSPAKKVISLKKSEKTSEVDTISEQHFTLILNEINEERAKNNYTTNCITIKKTKNSNIDSDFAIANFLQKKGFIISGREIISGDLDGYKIDFNGVCINLTIGKL